MLLAFGVQLNSQIQIDSNILVHQSNFDTEVPEEVEEPHTPILEFEEKYTFFSMNSWGTLFYQDRNLAKSSYLADIFIPPGC